MTRVWKWFTRWWTRWRVERTPARRGTKRPAPRRPRVLEPLETRRPLAYLDTLAYEYRTDSISLNGSYSYSELGADWEDRVPAGTFTSLSGELTWTSPVSGNGEFNARATGQGSNRGMYAGTWYGCSDYTLEEIGDFRFSVDSSAKTLRVRNTWADSMRYLQYRDTTPIGVCPQEEPWPRFFVGSGTGTFDPFARTLSRSYAQTNSAYPITATIPATTFQYANNAPADWVLRVVPGQEGGIEVPFGWSTVPQNASPPVEPLYDPNTAELNWLITNPGKAFAPQGDPAQAVGKVRLVWTDSRSDARREVVELPQSNATQLYWNTSRVEAKAEALPEPPEWAQFLKVELDLLGSTDASAANNSMYLPIAVTQTRAHQSGPLLPGQRLHGVANQLLHPSDAADPSMTVWSYAARSELGVSVSVLDVQGHFTYDPTGIVDWNYLPPGEFLTDVIYYQAARYGKYASYGEHTVVLMGVNDPPIAEDDHVLAWDHEPLTLSHWDYLGNDYDEDWDDELRLVSVVPVSKLGATIRKLEDGSLHYDPTTVPQFVALKAGETANDSFVYTISDRRGATVSATVHVQVNGSNSPPAIEPIGTQLTVVDRPFVAIPVRLSDPDSDLTAADLQAYAEDSSVIAEITISGSGATRQLALVPGEGVSGKTFVNLYVTDPEGASASLRFPVVVGTEEDLDLDGIPDLEEQAGPNQGDANGDGIPDYRQPQVSSLRTADGQAYLTLVVPEAGTLAQVSVDALPSMPTELAGVQFPFGGLRYELAHPADGAPIAVRIFASGTGGSANTAYRHVDADGGRWERWMHNGEHGGVALAGGVEFRVSDGGEGDADGASDGKIVVRVALGFVSNPWRNRLAEDVNNDGLVSPIDALLLINGLNRGEGRALSAVLVATDQIPDFLDVSGDLVFSPIDVLRIINVLNGEGEGEFVASRPGREEFFEKPGGGVPAGGGGGEIGLHPADRGGRLDAGTLGNQRVQGNLTARARRQLAFDFGSQQEVE